MLIVLLVFYVFLPNLFAAKPDDIPWAQGVGESTTENPVIHRSFQDIGMSLTALILAQLILIFVGKLIRVDAKWVALIMAVSLMLGIAVEFSSIGNSIIWGIMFRFRLEKYDAYVNLYLNLLSAGFIFVFSTVFGVVAEIVVAKFYSKAV